MTAKQQPGILRIGTSNIVVPGTKQTFPEAFRIKSRLHYYASLFNTLEVNSSFYKVPMASTFEKWSMDVPENFQFTIKLWKEITHVKNLQSDLDKIELFLKAAGHIGNKKGCLLVQFPGKITLEYFNEVEAILRKIMEHHDPNPWRKAIEFRHPSWYTGETMEMLDEYDASIVLHDIPKAKNLDLNKKAAFIYIRFHGPKGDYRGSYSDDFLNEKYGQIRGWQKSGKDVYAYFNNTMGNALENAFTLQKIAAANKIV